MVSEAQKRAIAKYQASEKGKKALNKARGKYNDVCPKIVLNVPQELFQWLESNSEEQESVNQCAIRFLSKLMKDEVA